MIGTKWVFKDQLDDDNKVVRNYERLACKGYTQVEGMVFEEIFTLIYQLEAIKILLEISIYKNLNVYQMDVKSIFLNNNLEEEVYIKQQEGFQLLHVEEYICILKKDMYGLK